MEQEESYEHLLGFVDAVAAAGCDRFTVHARKAVLGGLSPKANRTVPPLRYPDVYRLKLERPTLDIEINGGIRDLDAAAEHLQHVDAVMIGRAAYDDPYLFAAVDARFFADPAPASVALPRDEARRLGAAASDGAAHPPGLNVIIAAQSAAWSCRRSRSPAGAIPAGS